MSAVPLIELKNVGCTFVSRRGCFTYKKYEALKDVSLTVYQGETLGVIGSNGAGKSTLLKLMAKILMPTVGTISFFNDPVVALLGLQLGFNPELSGRINAILNAMLLGFSRREAEEQLDGIVEFAGLEDWIDDPLKTYSSGMQARLGFGVALQMNPDILLVDEVLGVGDQQFQKKSTAAMREKMLSDQTIVFVSHDLITLESLCKRCVWIEDGCTVAEGDSDEVIALYREKIGI
ncbi:ABC transporter ATP-binding protein [uncultured Pseudodesulfovibrio sp.]|uniref:ABC transporter ATP-binding protein n=1 Tax=uncultured Pseudodesulfovibrio sp. TaxID=2035858 RepID=UPI0029C7418F|nr:ABC transporter ATP-binding protein [uncultured Pseudodesulfovibrio sp.]